MFTLFETQCLEKTLNHAEEIHLSCPKVLEVQPGTQNLCFVGLPCFYDRLKSNQFP